MLGYELHSHTYYAINQTPRNLRPKQTAWIKDQGQWNMDI